MSFSLRNVALIWRKEVLDIIRDRRTLITMIVLPILLIPLLIFGAGFIVVKQINNMEAARYTVLVIGAERSPDLFASLEKSNVADFVEFTGGISLAREMLRGGAVEVVIVMPPEGLETTDEQPPRLLLLTNESREQSEIILGKVGQELQRVRKGIIRQRLSELNAPPGILTPYEWSVENIATGEQMSGRILGSFLPYVMILMTLTGALYPAIDLTAGEKERGTLETLLVSPASRLEIAMGKFLTVTCAAIVAATASLVSIVLVLGFGVSMIGPELASRFDFGLNFGLALLAVGMMVPLAAFFASLEMTIAIFAKSAREAQGYLTPLMVVAILPAMMSMMPGTTLTAKQAWIPLVNVSLALKDILSGRIDPGYLGMVLLSTSIYAAIGILITARVFQRESVLFRV